MVLGFVGVRLAELFQRRNLPVLAGPLRQTSLFLPLLPLVAYIIRPIADFGVLREAVPGMQPFLRFLDRMPDHFAFNAGLWFSLGLLYAVLALLRRASGYALMAALAANFGLWVIYAHNETLAFLLHPQVWLVPVGLILLAVETLHRDHLSHEQAQGIRYAGLLVIYISSTADMFITGLGNSYVLPIFLALLAVAGVLIGILLRIRAFLTMGVTFLALVVFAQIWHAAVEPGSNLGLVGVRYCPWRRHPGPFCRLRETPCRRGAHARRNSPLALNRLNRRPGPVGWRRAYSR